MQIIERSKHVRVENYQISFEWEDTPGAGFSFPCTKEGKLLMDKIPDTARGNLDGCLSGAFAVVAMGMQDWSHTHFQAAKGQCECGHVLTLWDPMTNTCECGREYNCGGQLLAPRSQWGDGDSGEGDDGVFGIWDDDNLF